MKWPFKLNLSSEIIISVILIMAISGSLSIYLISGHFFQQRFKEQLTTLQNEADNFIGTNIVNMQTYDFHEIYRSLQHYKFHPAVRYIALIDNNENILADKAVDDAREKIDQKDFVHIIKPVGINNTERPFANLHLYVDFSDLNRLLLHQRLILILIWGASLFAVLFLSILILRKITTPLENFTKHISSFGPKPKKVETIMTTHISSDIRTLINEFNKMVEQIDVYENTLRAQAVHAALGKIATQVAHDIRGPLSSMQTALGFFGEMKVEDKKFNDVMNLLQLSSKRLSGIADGLLQKHKGTEEIPATFSLYRILDELAGEYHGQYHDIRFVKKYTSSPVELCGDAGKLQRAFGNIVKNAVEAMEYKGTITITADIKTFSPSPQPSPTRGEGDYIVISIADTGPGMSSEKLGKVLKGGYTEGKKDGHGIGTQVVKQTVEEFKGKLTGESQEGQGTIFFITLPLPEQKSTAELTIDSCSGEPIIIIDDDPSLREQWRMALEEKGKQTLLCDSYEDFEKQKITTNISQIAIVDYHFDNSEKTGADILRLLKQQGFTNLYLCTAEYWKPSVQQLAQELQVILCPKPLPRIVIANLNNDVIASSEGAKQSPVGTNGDCFVATAPRNDKESCHDKKSGYTVLVIDDDPGVQMSWELMKDKLQIKNLHCYSNMEEMQSNGVNLGTIDIAFVDKNIEGSAFSGAAVLSFLKEKCVGKIILASGENEKELRKDPQFNSADFITRDKVPSSLSKFFNK